MTFEEKLKQVFFSGMTQKELAERAGLSLFTINKIWLGKSNPNKKTIIAIEKAIAELEKERLEQ